MASEPPPRIDRICSTPGCGKILVARGFCVACYYRLLRRGEIVSKTPTERWKHRLSDIDTENKTAICAECGMVKIQKRADRKSKTIQWRCVTEANERSRLYKRAYRQAKKNMLGDVCEICGTKDDLCWDHDHTTGMFRGTLCGLCNCAIGMMNDNPERLMAAASYLVDKASKFDAVPLEEAIQIATANHKRVEDLMAKEVERDAAGKAVWEDEDDE